MIFANGVAGWFFGPVHGVSAAQFDTQILALKTERNTSIQPGFDAHLFATHAHAHTASGNLIALPTKLDRVIVADGPLLDMAQNSG
jgi:hypothetical protein